MKSNIFARMLLVAVASSTAVNAEICNDVRRLINEKVLKVSLVTEYQEYVPGELIRFSLVFQNNSSRPIVVPSSSEGLFQEIEVSQSIVRDGERFFHPINEIPSHQSIVFSNGVASIEEEKHCETTLRPHVLLGGDKYELMLSSVQSWKSGSSISSSMLATASDRSGLFLFEVSSGRSLRFGTELRITEPESSDRRCIVTERNGLPRKAVECREIAIVKLNNQFIALLSTSVSLMGSIEELQSYSKRVLGPPKDGNAFVNFERLFVSKESIEFGQPTLTLRSANGSISIVGGKGQVVAVRPSDFAPRTSRNQN